MCAAQEFNKKWNEQMQAYERECAEQEHALTVSPLLLLRPLWP
jgi:hypothetical protein